MSVILALTVETRTEELERLFNSVELLAKEEDWPPALTFKVHLIIEELGINIIRYGHDSGVHDFEITLTSESDALTIEIIDDGQPFNPLQDGPQPDTEAAIEDRPIGGLGVHLVREMTDDMQYRREDSKNYSTMVIRKAV